jgi:hypothetical protein
MNCVVEFANLSCLLWKQTYQVLGAFAQLRKATISFIMSVCPPTWNNSVPTRRVFIKCDISLFLENVFRKVKLHYNMIRITATVRQIHLFSSDIVLSVAL